MNEKLIEKKLREGVKRLGGLSLKFTSPSFTGVPDRISLWPSGAMDFVELKSTGRPLSARQVIVFAELEELGFPVTVIDSQEKLDAYFASKTPKSLNSLVQ
jgi:VRR-NUC domain-containing protein